MLAWFFASTKADKSALKALHTHSIQRGRPSMDSFEFNKYAGAVLAALLVLFGTRTLIDEVMHSPKPEKPGYEVAALSTEGEASGDGGDTVKGPTVVELLVSADADGGKKSFKKCAACHTIDKGGANRVGPNLHSIVGRDVASVGGFSYSAILQEKDGQWDYAALDGFLANPKKYAPGTKMAFAGLKKVGERANVIAYLRENTDNPPPLPENADSADAGTGQAVADGEKQAETEPPDAGTENAPQPSEN